MLEHTHASIATLVGDKAEELVRDQVRQLRDAGARQKRLESLLIQAYHALPTPNHLDSTPASAPSLPPSQVFEGGPGFP